MGPVGSVKLCSVVQLEPDVDVVSDGVSTAELDDVDGGTWALCETGNPYSRRDGMPGRVM